VLEVTERRGELETLMPAMLADYEHMSTDRSYERSHAGYRALQSPALRLRGRLVPGLPQGGGGGAALEESAPARLFDVADIGVGPASGANEAFALSVEEEAALPRGEQALVRHFVRAEHCARWASVALRPISSPTTSPTSRPLSAAIPPCTAASRATGPPGSTLPAQ